MGLLVEKYMSSGIKEKPGLWFGTSKGRKAIHMEKAKQMFDKQMFAGP